MINWDSVPVYDSWGVTDDLWDGNQWIEWNIALRNHYPKDQADIIWVKAWLDGVSVLGGGTGNAPGAGYMADSVPVNDRSFNTTFRNYINAEGNELLYNAVFTGLGGEVGKAISGTVEVAENIGTAATTVVKNASKTVTALSYIIPLLLIILLLFATYEGVKKIKTL